jgi:hypothetical protein
MTPNAFFGKLEQSRSIRVDRSVVPRTSFLFFSLPFFLLREFAENNLPTRSGLFPTRALLQSQNSAINKARELSQALRRLYLGDREVCLHVSQVWCLAIGGGEFYPVLRTEILLTIGQTIFAHVQPYHSKNSLAMLARSISSLDLTACPHQ